MDRKRRVLEWKNNTVVYMERYEFRFDPTRSKSFDTQIPTINTPFLVRLLFTV